MSGSQYDIGKNGRKPKTSPVLIVGRGSWQERQICDADTFSLPQDDARSRTEFYLPLIFYAFDWLLFFMTIPRSWTAIEKQHSPSQSETVARPSALDARFKAGALCSFAAWTVICYSLNHSRVHYRPKIYMLIEHPFDVNNSLTKTHLGILITAITVGYTIASAWIWSVSPLNAHASNGWIFGLGYGPAILLIVVYNIFGSVHSNDDQAMMAQRQYRERNIDRELGIDRTTMKPSWWSKMRGDSHGGLSAEERLRQLTSEVGGGPATSRNIDVALEMKYLRTESDNEDGQSNSNGAKPAEGPPPYFIRGSTMLEPDPSPISAGRSAQDSQNSSPARSLQAKPQVVRSMLDL